MQTIKTMPEYNRDGHHRMRGFTLVELIVTMVVASIAMSGILSVYVSQSKAYSVNDDLADMQQNLRAAMYLLKNDLRNAGRNPMMTETVGLVAVGLYNADSNSTDGYPGVTMTRYVDTNGDGTAEMNTIETISYQVMDADGDGHRELRRMVDNDGNWHLVMDGIEDIGFAYAIDADHDMDLDRAGSGANATIVWAVDTDTTAGLDTNADSNGDGDFTEDDYDGTTGRVNTASGSLGAQVPLRDIRAVQIWLLARSPREFNDYDDTRTYILGRKMLDLSSLDAKDSRRRHRHVLLTSAVALNNHERHNTP
jgi:type IV pilus assembly protein PilW